MRVSKRKSMYTLCAIILLLFVESALGYNSSSSESMLPEGLIIEDKFKPGFGSPVGKVLLVQGKVVIIHSGMVRGYWAKKDLSLFKGDTIITREKGRIQFELNDESILTLASRTKLVINRSVYDPRKKSRSSFLGMPLGKVRFWVKKLIDLRYSEFKVKTITLTVGVRGSDFIIMATPKLTEVTALKETELEVVSLAFPEVKPVIITDFERVVVEKDALPSEIMKVSPEEIEQMIREIIITPRRAKPVRIVDVQKEKAEKKETPKEPLAKPEAPEGEKPAAEEPAPGEEPGIIVSGDALAEPEDIAEPEVLEEPPVPDIVEENEMSGQEEATQEQQEEIIEEQHEEEIKTRELPPLPPPPGG